MSARRLKAGDAVWCTSNDVVPRLIVGHLHHLPGSKGTDELEVWWDCPGAFNTQYSPAWHFATPEEALAHHEGLVMDDRVKTRPRNRSTVDMLDDAAFQQRLRDARAHWLQSKESAFGKAREYAMRALEAAVRDGKPGVNLKADIIGPCTPEMTAWAESVGCTMQVGSHPMEDEAHYYLKWNGVGR